jgi:phosphoglycerate dehydrogenase-like enzyme
VIAWIPDREGRDAVGNVPSEVSLDLIPPKGDLPDALLAAEFLVPIPGDARVPELLARMPDLRVVQTLSAGVDTLQPHLPAGVTLCDAGGSRDSAVAEWVIAAILSSVRTLPELRDEQREHRWEWRRSAELAGTTVMILGYGSIGAAVETRLAPFRVELIRVARTARAGVHPVQELASLLPRADVVVVLLPLTPATKGLLDAAMLQRLPPGALLVNAARGAVIDGDALLTMLQARRMRAVLDVTDPEPLPGDHPLWDAPDTFITPHYAGDTLAAERRAFALVGEQLRRFARSQPLANVVEHGY